MKRALQEDWEQFVRENQESIRQEGLLDIESLIQDSYELTQDIQDDMPDLEEIEYETSDDTIICVNCRKAYLSPSTNGNTHFACCQNCGFYATPNCLNQIITAVTQHSTVCNGSIGFSLEPGTDNTIIANCETCDLWDIFYM